MIAYGYSIKENDDPYVKVLDAAVTGMSETANPGAFLVDTIPSRESYSLYSCTTEDANYDYHFLAPIRPTSQLIRHVDRLTPALRPPSSSSPYSRQCDTSLTGSPEQGGRSRPSYTKSCSMKWWMCLFNS